MPQPDPQAILTALGQVPAPCQAISGGADTLIWRVEADGGPLALRVFRPEQAPVAAVEARVMGWLNSVGFPVPKVLALGEHAGRPALLMDWVLGETLTTALIARPDRATALGAAFGRTLARLHALEPAPELVELARRQGGLVTVPAGSPPSRLSALHLDYHGLNVLVQGDAVSGVIDWANVRLGDPRADLARSLTLLSVHPGFYRLTGTGRATLRRFRRAFVTDYAEASTTPVLGLAPFLAWAGEHLRSDLATRLDPADLRRIERWTALWQVRTGATAPGPSN